MFARPTFLAQTYVFVVPVKTCPVYTWVQFTWVQDVFARGTIESVFTFARKPSQTVLTYATIEARAGLAMIYANVTVFSRVTFVAKTSVILETIEAGSV